MKNCSIFVAFTPRTILLIAVAVFFIAIVGRYNNGLSTPYGYCTAKSVIVLGGTRVVQPFFCTYTTIFSFMPRTMKNCKTAQGASTATQTERNAVSKLFHPEFIEFTTQLSLIANWFVDYRKKINSADDHIHERLNELDNHLSEAAHYISELVAIEFQENIFYK